MRRSPLKKARIVVVLLVIRRPQLAFERRLMTHRNKLLEPRRKWQDGEQAKGLEEHEEVEEEEAKGEAEADP